MVSSHHHRPDTVHHIPRYLAFLFCFYLAFAAPAANAIGAAADAAATAAAARAAAALGAGEGLGVALGGAAAAAAAVGAFALTFCLTSMALGDNLCAPDSPDTGGSINEAIADPAQSGSKLYHRQPFTEGLYYSTPEAVCRVVAAAVGQTFVSLDRSIMTCKMRKTNGDDDYWSVTIVDNPNYDPTKPALADPTTAGDAIAGNPRAAAGIGGAAAAKARGASDSAANAAAHAAAAATGTGNPARSRAAGNTAAAAGAAAAAAEAAGGSEEDVKKAARDAANTAAAAADKAVPEEKTCQSNSASVDGRYCTDAAAQPKPTQLPVYCTWAIAVCAFIDWVKAEPEVTTDAKANNIEAENDTYDNYNLPSNPNKQVNILVGGQCPSDVHIPVFMGINWDFSYKAACDIAGYAKYAFIAAASISAVFIVTGNRESE